MAKKKHVQVPSEPAKRTLADIQAEYVRVCTEAGDKQYRTEILKGELAQLNSRLYQLNQEAAAIKQEERPVAQNSQAPAATKQSDAGLQ